MDSEGMDAPAMMHSKLVVCRFLNIELEVQIEERGF